MSNMQRRLRRNAVRRAGVAISASAVAAMIGSPLASAAPPPNSDAPNANQKQTPKRLKTRLVEELRAKGVYIDPSSLEERQIRGGAIAGPKGGIKNASFDEAAPTATTNATTALSVETNDTLGVQAAPIGFGSYWLYSPTACYTGQTATSDTNSITWCYQKQKMAEDPNDTYGDHWLYKRWATAFPDRNSFRGLTNWQVGKIQLWSYPSPGTESRFKGLEDWAPRSAVSSDSGSALLINTPIGAQLNIGGGGADLLGTVDATKPGKIGVQFKGNWWFSDRGKTKDTAFMIAVKTGQGQIPYWGDRTYASFVQYGTCASFSVSDCVGASIGSPY
jgi:hypothetical protein